MATWLGGRGPASTLIGVILGSVLVLGVTVACEPTLRQETGVVMEVDSPALGQVDRFRLLTTGGRILTFDTTSLTFRPEFPASHLAEHQLIGDLIVVTYRQDGARLLVTQRDASGGPGH